MPKSHSETFLEGTVVPPHLTSLVEPILFCQAGWDVQTMNSKCKSTDYWITYSWLCKLCWDRTKTFKKKSVCSIQE